MAKRSGKGYSGGGSNNNVNGKSGMAKAMAERSPSRPARVVKAPTHSGTMGPGSRIGGAGTTLKGMC